MTRSIHDNVVLGYDVDIEAKRIVLRTRSEGGERVDVVFDGVLGYLLLDAPLAGSILLDIEEVPFSDFLDEYGDLFAQERQYYWPFDGQGDPAAFVSSKGARTLSIQPSIGLSGFVVSASMMIVAV